MSNIKTPSFPDYNFATESFLKRMTDREMGSYLVIGATGSGKTTLLREYIRNLPNNVKATCFTEVPSEFDGLPYEAYTPNFKKRAFRDRPNVIVSDCPSDLELFSEVLMASITNNVALSSHANSIADFIYREKDNRFFQLNQLNLLENVKGFTYSKVVVLENGVRKVFQESLLNNHSLISDMLKLDSEAEIGDFIDWEMARQGLSTISQQVAAYNNLFQ